MSAGGPVFLVGVPRSGTKLLRAFLDNHPALFMPPFETECLPWLMTHTPPGGWVGDAGFDALWQAMRGLPYFDYLSRAGMPLTQALWRQQCPDRSAAGVFDGLVRATAVVCGRTGWQVWGDKSPSHTAHVAAIARQFPAARFIHIVRDVRDVAASSRQAWGKHPLRTAQRWRDDVLSVRAAYGQPGIAVQEVRFEALVQDPRAVLQDLMAFLGLPFDERMLVLPAAPENLGSARGRKTVLATAAGRFRGRFSVAQIGRIERVTIDAMQAYGYVPQVWSGPQQSLAAWRMRLLRCYDAVQLVRHRRQDRGLLGAIGFYRRYDRFSGNRMPGRRPLLMLGTGLATRGGIASVVRAYRDSGLLARQNVHYLPTHGDGPRLWKLALAVSAWCRLQYCLHHHCYRLVHVHLSSGASFWRKELLLRPLRRAGLPFVLHLHGSEFREFYAACTPARQARVRALLEAAAAVVVLSTSWRQWVQGVSANPRVVIVPNAVPLPATVSARQAGQLLFLGRLGERKGIHTLLQALALLRPQFPALQLVCAGDGEVDAVRARVQALGLQDCVTVPGWIDAEARRRLLAQAAVLVLPSHNEGLPMAVLEAMAAGLAVVATPVGGIPDAVVDGETGLLVPPGDAAALAQALHTLLDDPVRLARLGDAARARIARDFSPAAHEARLHALWQQVAP